MTFENLLRDDPVMFDYSNSKKRSDNDVTKEMLKVFEGRDLKSIMSKEFPDVIAQLIGPRSPADPENGENGFYTLNMIVVPFKQREKGIANTYMKRLVQLAKKDQKDVFLTPDDGYSEDDGMTKGQLTQWYKKLGFERKHKDDFRAQHTYCFYS